MRNNLAYRAIIIIIILILSSNLSAANNGSDRLFAKDKLYHFGISAILSAEIGFVAHNHFESSVDGSVLIGFTAGFSSVSFKEIIDSATPGRHSSGKDIIANFLGALAGTAALYLLIK